MSMLDVWGLVAFLSSTLEFATAKAQAVPLSD